MNKVQSAHGGAPMHPLLRTDLPLIKPTGKQQVSWQNIEILKILIKAI